MYPINEPHATTPSHQDGYSAEDGESSPAHPLAGQIDLASATAPPSTLLVPAAPPVPAEWRLPSASATLSVELHSEPRTQGPAPLASTPTSTAAPQPKTIVVDLENIIGTIPRYRALQKALSGNPNASGISIKSVTLADVQLFPEAAASYPNLRHVHLKLSGQSFDGYESQLVSALEQLDGLTSVEIDVEYCPDSDMHPSDCGLLLCELASIRTLESILLRGGLVDTDDVPDVFEAFREQGRLHTLVMDNFANEEPDDESDGAVETLLRCAAWLPSLKNLALLSYWGGVANGKAIAELLKNTSTLESFETLVSLCDRQDAELIGAALETNASIKKLIFNDIDLQCIPIKIPDAEASSQRFIEGLQDEGEFFPALQPIASAIEKNKSLNSVAFDFFPDTDHEEGILSRECGVLLGATSRNPRITKVQASLITEENYLDVLNLIKTNRQLQSLTVFGTIPSHEIFKQLVQEIENHPSLMAFKLNEFDLGKYDRFPATLEVDEDGDGNIRASTMEAVAASTWKINNPRAAFRQLQFRISMALSSNQAKHLGAVMSVMMESLQSPLLDMLPLLPPEVSEQILTLALMLVEEKDRENLVDAFQL
jgi:hypothetical protein